MVREMVERTMPNPTVEEIAKIKLEAKNRAVKSGAVADSVEVFLEIDDTTQKVTAIAMGSTEVKTTDLQKRIDEKEAIEIAKGPYPAGSNVDVQLTYTNGKVFVAQGMYKNKNSLRIVDTKGFVKVQRGEGELVKTTFGKLKSAVKQLWESCGNYTAEIMITPDIYIINDVILNLKLKSRLSVERTVYIKNH